VTSAEFGRATRLRRLFSRGSGRALIVAWAHGPLLGPIPGTGRDAIESLGESLAPADGILVSPSMLPGLRRVLARRDRPSAFLLLDWQSVSRPADLLGYEEGATAPLTTVDAATASGLDGVMTYLYTGWRDPAREALEVARIGAVSEQCRRHGLLHLVESRAVREERGPDGLARTELVLYHTRLAAELGADLVKTIWTGAASFPEVVAGCPVPVLLAGGGEVGSSETDLDTAEAMVASGAHGLVWGRKIFQSGEPDVTLHRLLALVHGGRPGAA
jgi:DhnA family fructose-bisphosphate aldolase class Ia